jgi:hypothetical protein
LQKVENMLQSHAKKPQLPRPSTLRRCLWLLCSFAAPRGFGNKTSSFQAAPARAFHIMLEMIWRLALSILKLTVFVEVGRYPVGRFLVIKVASLHELQHPDEIMDSCG